MHLRKHDLRFILVFLFFFLALFIFAIKLTLIQVFRSEHLAALAKKQQNHYVELEPVRGAILDRNLRPLAFNIPVDSLYANPKTMTAEDKKRAIQQLPAILQMSSGDISDRVGKNKYFVWMKRKLSAEEAKQVNNLRIRGLGFRKESKRFYPNGSLAAHVIGFASVDNDGLEGLELFYNKELKGSSGWMRILRDAHQRELMLERDYFLAKNGYHVVLTIDETIQYLAESALEKAMKKHNAKGASIIVIDVKTGEILAFANLPTYNLDHAAQSPVANRTNRAISFFYEPGSVFKIVTAAAALEEEQFVETDKIFCENGSYKVANHILHDHRPHGTLTFREVFEMSSNIGVTKIAQKLGPEIIYKYGKRFRFGELTGIDMYGEVAGYLKPVSQWSKTSIGAIPIGQEVVVTPLQLIYAMAAIANDGVMMKPSFVKAIKDGQEKIIRSFEPQVAGRVISVETARRLTEILVGVTENGTAPQAKIQGIRVAGKTGTAQKVVGGAYSHSQFYATFMGYAPADNPQLAAIVVFDEPHPSYFGGTVAAPVFQEVIENSLKYLQTLDAPALTAVKR